MKKFLLLTCIAAGFYSNAQSIGNSPYAAFGIGDVKYDNSIENSGMAGLSTAYISDFTSNFNFKNPAANENVQLTSIRLEGTNENNFFSSNVNNYKGTKHSTYLSNISIAFPISEKLKFGVGYQPYSSKRYNILTTQNLENGIQRNNSMRGEGSVNTVHTALSYQINSAFAIGLRANYYFGNIYDKNEITFSNAELINGHEIRNEIKGMNFTLGATYQKKFDDDKKLTLGATTTFGNIGDMMSYYTNSTYYYGPGSTKIYENIIDQKDNSNKTLLPLQASVGVGYGQNTRWFVGTQVDYKKRENMVFEGTSAQSKDLYRISAGGWILPNANNFRNYLERVIYRYGAFYEKGNLNINNTDINTVGITLGATFPFKNSSISRITGLDFAVELGKKGTTQNNLINQNFINVKLGFNFADKWFNKRLYN